MAPGGATMTIAANNKSMTPFSTSHPQRPDSTRLCSSANIIEKMASIIQKAISTKFSEITPPTGQPIKMIPTVTPRTAENSDHQKPGARLSQTVVIRPGR